MDKINSVVFVLGCGLMLWGAYQALGTGGLFLIVGWLLVMAAYMDKLRGGRWQ
jgi:hypothetical protein